ncbi:MAG: T9SS type A sorting domain-containing protein [Saprospiraceae bacterium]
MLGFSQSILAHVALDYPHGGETFIEGQTVTIEWHIIAPHVTLNWDLYFSSDGGENWQPIQLDIPLDSLSYTWHVPSVATLQGRVRIIQDNQGQDYLAISMDFTIVPNTSPPSLDAPANNIIIECGIGNPEATLLSWLDNHGGASVTNHCGQLNWTNDFFQLTNNCGSTGDAIVTFTATDECGSTYSVASVYIIDLTPPVFDVLPICIVVECDGHGNLPGLNAWLANHGGAHTADACGNVVWTNDLSPLLQQCGVTGSIIVSFMATDECGNSAASTASFTIADRVAPEINGNAQDLILNCGTLNEQDINQWLENHGGAHATDLCGMVHWSHDYSALNHTCGFSGNATVTFTVTDDCGNVSTTSASLNIEDHLAPVINQSAQDNTIVCGAFNPEGLIQSWIDMHGGAEATDACGSVSWTNDYAGLNDGCGITGSVLVIFTASDECGNGSTTSAILSLIDQIPPVIDIEARDTTIVCGLPDQEMIIQQWLDQHGGAKAHDECGDIFWQYDIPVVENGCDTTVSYVVTFTVVDECGNSNLTTASFTIMSEISSDGVILSAPEFKLYPNPMHDLLTIDFSRNDFKPLRLSLFDTYGKLLWSAPDSRTVTSIPMSQYEPGVYFLRVEMENRTFMKAVIKQ